MSVYHKYIVGMGKGKGGEGFIVDREVWIHCMHFDI